MIKYKYHSLIIGGTGQFGITLKNQLNKKNKKVIITSRFKKSIIKKKEFEIVVLDVLNKEKIFKIIKKYKPQNIFYFASQSSPIISFIKKNETIRSNYIGCKNVLESVYKIDKNINFIYAASSEIYGKIKGKISLKSKKYPINPYGISKLKGLNITKLYREKYKIKAYNAIIFNTESTLRDKSFFIPKVCIAAINAYKYNLKTAFGNLDIKREWNWCDDQCELLIKFLNKKPQDFIISNGKCLSAKKMLKFAFDYFNLDYKRYILKDKKFLRPVDIKIKTSKYKESLIKNKITKKNFTYGKKMINLMIKNYLKLSHK
jgi:GDPmannose 4,6-dehydratase